MKIAVLDKKTLGDDTPLSEIEKHGELICYDSTPSELVSERIIGVDVVIVNKVKITRDVIMSSYLRARATGDKNVYFIDGLSFNVAPNQYDASVDAVHPNDMGFVRMASTIGTVIRHILEKNT